jgi:hypothetical protein
MAAGNNGFNSARNTALSQLLAALGMLVAAFGEAAAQGVVRSVHADWQIAATRRQAPRGVMRPHSSVTARTAPMSTIVLSTADKSG